MSPKPNDAAPGSDASRWNYKDDAEMIAQSFEDREDIDDDDVDYLENLDD